MAMSPEDHIINILVKPEVDKPSSRSLEGELAKLENKAKALKVSLSKGYPKAEQARLQKELAATNAQITTLITTSDRLGISFSNTDTATSGLTTTLSELKSINSSLSNTFQVQDEALKNLGQRYGIVASDVKNYAKVSETVSENLTKKSNEDSQKRTKSVEDAEKRIQLIRERRAAIIKAAYDKDHKEFVAALNSKYAAESLNAQKQKALADQKIEFMENITQRFKAMEDQRLAIAKAAYDKDHKEFVAALNRKYAAQDLAAQKANSLRDDETAAYAEQEKREADRAALRKKALPSFSKLDQATEKYTRQITILNQALKAQVISRTEYTNALKVAKKAHTDAAAAVDQHQSSWHRHMTYMESAGVVLKYGLISQALYGIQNAMRLTAAAALEFDASTRRISAVMGESLETSRLLGKELENLGGALGGSLSEINQAAISLGRAGVKMEDLADATEVVVKMALLTGDTIAESTSAIASYRQVFSDTSTTVIEFGNQLAYAANKSRLSTQDIGTFSNYALAAGKSVGLASEQILGLATAFSNFGLNASTIGTQIRKLAEMIKTTTSASDVFFRTLGTNQGQLLDDLQAGGETAKGSLRDFISSITQMSKEQYNAAVAKLPLLQKNVIDTIRKTGTAANTHIAALFNSQSNNSLEASKVIAGGYTKMWERMVNTALVATNTISNEAMNRLFEDVTDAEFDEFLARVEIGIYGISGAISGIAQALLVYAGILTVVKGATLLWAVANGALATATAISTTAILGTQAAVFGLQGASYKASLAVGTLALSLKGVGAAAGWVGLALTALYAAYEAYDSLTTGSDKVRERAMLEESEAVTKAAMGYVRFADDLKGTELALTRIDAAIVSATASMVGLDYGESKEDLIEQSTLIGHLATQHEMYNRKLKEFISVRDAVGNTSSVSLFRLLLTDGDIARFSALNTHLKQSAVLSEKAAESALSSTLELMKDIDKSISQQQKVNEHRIKNFGKLAAEKGIKFDVDVAFNVERGDIIAAEMDIRKRLSAAQKEVDKAESSGTSDELAKAKLLRNHYKAYLKDIGLIVSATGERTKAEISLNEIYAKQQTNIHNLKVAQAALTSAENGVFGDRKQALQDALSLAAVNQRIAENSLANAKSDTAIGKANITLINAKKATLEASSTLQDYILDQKNQELILDSKLANFRAKSITSIAELDAVVLKNLRDTIAQEKDKAKVTKNNIATKTAELALEEQLAAIATRKLTVSLADLTYNSKMAMHKARIAAMENGRVLTSKEMLDITLKGLEAKLVELNIAHKATKSASEQKRLALLIASTEDSIWTNKVKSRKETDLTLKSQQRLLNSIREKEAILKGETRTRLQLLEIQRDSRALDIENSTFAKDSSDHLKLREKFLTSEVAIKRELQSLATKEAARTIKRTDTNMGVISNSANLDDDIMTSSEYLSGVLKLNEAYEASASKIASAGLSSAEFETKMISLNGVLFTNKELLASLYTEETFQLSESFAGIDDLSSKLAGISNQFAAVYNLDQKIKTAKILETGAKTQEGIANDELIKAEKLVTAAKLEADAIDAELAAAKIARSNAIAENEVLNQDIIADAKANDGKVSEALMEKKRKAMLKLEKFEERHKTLKAKQLTATSKLGKVEAHRNVAQDKFNNAAEVTAKLSKVTNKLESEKTETQLEGYSDIAGAMSSMFAEGSKAAAAFQIAQTALAVVSGVTAIVQAGTNGDPYTAIARMAAMAAMVSATLSQAGIAFGGVSNIDNPDEVFDAHSAKVSNTGVGSVLGDSEAISESIANSLEILSDQARPEFALFSQMNTSLISIDNKMGGLSAQILQNQGFALGDGFTGTNTSGTANNSIEGTLNQLGEITLALNSPLLALAGFGDEAGKAVNLAFDAAVGLFDVFTFGLTSSLVSEIEGFVFGGGTSSSQSVSDAGFTFNPQLMQDAITAIEGQAFQTIKTHTVRSRSWGRSDVHTDYYNTSYENLNDEITNQFQLILGDMYDAVVSAGSILGVDQATIDAGISDYTVDLGKISLLGKTGEEIEELLSSIFGKVGDELANEAIPRLLEFQRVGEGYLETLSRVASGFNEASYFAGKLGTAFEVLSFDNIGSTQGDVGLEVLRTAIMTFEDQMYESANGISSIVEVLQGSSEDLFTAYDSLVGIRDQFLFLGLGYEGVTSGLLLGADGIDNLTASLEVFFESMVSDTDQLAFNTSELTEEFAKLNLSLPVGADGFKELVEGIDSTTVEGQQLLGGVLALTEGFVELTEGMKDALDAQVQYALDSAALESIIAAERQAVLDAQTDFTISSLNGILTTITGIRSKLTEEISGGPTIDSYQKAYQDFLDFEGTQDELTTVLANLTKQSASLFDTDNFASGEAMDYAQALANVRLGGIEDEARDQLAVLNGIEDELYELRVQLGGDNLLKVDLAGDTIGLVSALTGGLLTLGSFAAGGDLDNESEQVFRGSFTADSFESFNEELETLRTNLSYLALDTTDASTFFPELATANSRGYGNLLEFFESQGSSEDYGIETEVVAKMMELINFESGQLGFNDLTQDVTIDSILKALSSGGITQAVAETQVELLGTDFVTAEEYLDGLLNGEVFNGYSSTSDFDPILESANAVLEVNRSMNAELLAPAVSYFESLSTLAEGTNLEGYFQDLIGKVDTLAENSTILEEGTVDDFFKWLEGTASDGYTHFYQNLGLAGIDFDALTSSLSFDQLTRRASEIVSLINLNQSADSTVSGNTGYILDGSHATGLDYVPKDGYIAELHKGERVMPAAENRVYMERPMLNTGQVSDNRDVVIAIKGLQRELHDMKQLQVRQTANGQRTLDTTRALLSETIEQGETV